jgi:putative ABC transport system permease protein
MRALDRKLLRDLVGLKSQLLAIGLVLACGVVTFVMSLSTMDSLDRTLHAYYDRTRFADVFAHLTRAPESLAGRIRALPGVARAETRVVSEVPLDVAGQVEPAVGRLASWPAHGRPLLNDLYLRAGRWIEPGRPGEVLLGEGFAAAHGIQPGGHVVAVLNGRRQRLHVVGIVLSPEFVYPIRPGEYLPDDKRYALLWMGRPELAAAFDMDGAFNDVTLALMPGASEADVIGRLDRLLAPYGGVGAYGRDLQVSNRYVSEEMKQLRNTALVMPAIFLGVAAFLLNVVLARIVATQREQIAVLKAFGYSSAAVGVHYLKLVLLAVLLGSLVGVGVGAWLGRGLTRMYTHFFHFPIFTYHLAPQVVGLALLVAAAACALGTLGSVRRAARLPPAEAMRPEPPLHYGPTLLERLGLSRLLTPGGRMVLRQLERKPLKSLLACVGIALAVGILVMGNFMGDTIDAVVEHDFNVAQRQDVTVATVEPLSSRAVAELASYPGVSRAEPFRAVAARLRHGWRSRRLGILGLEPDAALYRPLGAGGRPLRLPERGVLLSATLGEILGVRAGDRVEVDILEGRRPTLELPVAGLVTDYTGLNAYMTLDALNVALHEGDRVSGAYLAVDPARRDDLYRRLQRTPKVASVGIKLAALASFRETMAESMMTIRTIYVLFASIIAIGVVYNTARISLSERSRELATLRVMGFTRAEISALLLGELGALTVVALPLGLAIGRGFAVLVMHMVDSETYRFPLAIAPRTYAFAAGVILVAALVSGLVVRRKLDRLDLLAVLKSRE